MNHQEIIAYSKEIYNQAKKMFPDYDLPFPRISFFRNSRTAGRAWTYENRIEFNDVYAVEYSNDFTNTIIHEFSHIIARIISKHPIKSHGPEFKYVFMRLGGNGSRTHNYTTTSQKIRRQERVKYHCGCRVHMVSMTLHNKMQRGQGRHCLSCKGSLIIG